VTENISTLFSSFLSIEKGKIENDQPPAPVPVIMNLLDTPDFFLSKEQRAEKKQLEAAVKFKERFVSFVLFCFGFPFFFSSSSQLSLFITFTTTTIFQLVLNSGENGMQI